MRQLLDQIRYLLNDQLEIDVDPFIVNPRSIEDTLSDVAYEVVNEGEKLPRTVMYDDAIYIEKPDWERLPEPYRRDFFSGRIQGGEPVKFGRGEEVEDFLLGPVREEWDEAKDVFRREASDMVVKDPVRRKEAIAYVDDNIGISIEGMRYFATDGPQRASVQFMARGELEVVDV